MSRQRNRHFRVGVMVVGAAVLFAGMLAFTVGSSLHRHTEHYCIRFDDNVKGMVVGSKAKEALWAPLAAWLSRTAAK